MRTAALVLLAAVLASGCNNNSTTTPASTSTTSSSTEIFSGSLDVQGSGFYSFTVSTAGTTSITLLAITSGGVSVPITMGLGVGAPVATSCSVTTSLNATSGLTAQLVTTLSPGIYCANLADAGNLTGPVNFVVRIVHT